MKRYSYNVTLQAIVERDFVDGWPIKKLHPRPGLTPTQLRQTAEYLKAREMLHAESLRVIGGPRHAQYP